MLITETWRDSTALACHRASAHVASAIGALRDKLAAAPQVRELTSFS
jgi:quinol monooxygenase YgiN